MGPFAAGAMLLWSAVAGVPLVLHLLRRRRRRTVDWGAMQFLQRAIARQAKRFQLWRLLLLALRMLLVIVIAAALARPMIGRPARIVDDAIRRSNVLRLLVIDDSYSMQARLTPSAREGENSTRFTRAQQWAIDLCKRANNGDAFLVVLASQPARPLQSEVSYRAAEVADQIERLRPGEGVARLPESLAIVQSALQAIPSNENFDRIEVIVFSDMQATTWDQTDVPNIDRPIRWLAIDCRQDSIGANVAVTGLQPQTTAGGSDPSLQSWISSVAHLSGDQPIRGMLAQLLVDGQVEQSQRLDLERGESKSLQWSARLNPGRHAVEVRLSPTDILAVDNRNHQIVDVRNRISVALFSDQESDSRYLQLAASPDDQGTFVVQTFPFSAIAKTEWGRHSVWVLCNPGKLSAGAKDRLQGHVQQGGGLVWWLGPAWQANESSGFNVALPLNESLNDSAQNSEGTTDPISAKQRDLSQAMIDPMDYRSPIVGPFEPFPGSGLLTLPVFRFWQLNLDSSWQMALGIRESDTSNEVYPLLATREAPFTGRQVIVTTPASPTERTSEDSQANADPSTNAAPWNAIIAWPAFVPLVQQTLGWAANQDGYVTDFKVGQTLQGSSAENQTADRLQGTDQYSLAVRVLQKQADRVLWTSSPALRAGFYSFASTTNESRTPVAAVNLDYAEGDLRPLLDLPEPWIQASPSDLLQPLESDTATNSNLDETTASLNVQNTEIAWWLLVIALITLGCESALVRMLEHKF